LASYRTISVPDIRLPCDVASRIRHEASRETLCSEARPDTRIQAVQRKGEAMVPDKLAWCEEGLVSHDVDRWTLVHLLELESLMLRGRTSWGRGGEAYDRATARLAHSSRSRLSKRELEYLRDVLQKCGECLCAAFSSHAR
jgi:hypothetical protein